MLSFLLVVTLSAGPQSPASASGPRAHPKASAAIYIPRLDRLTELTGFLRAAGQHAVALRTDGWRSEMHPLLLVDLTRPEEVAEAGLDPKGSVTVSKVGNARMTCAALADPQRFVEKAGQRLTVWGAPWKSTEGGVPLVGAQLDGRVLGGYALKGRQACAVYAYAGHGESLLREAARVVGTTSKGSPWNQLAALPGSAYLVSADGVGSVHARGESLTVTARSSRFRLPKLLGSGSSPYASMESQGLGVFRARVAPTSRRSVVAAMQAQLAEACPTCDSAAMRELAGALPPLLTGQIALYVDRVKVAESLRSAAGRYFSVRHVYLLESSKPGALTQLLDRLGKWKQSRKTDEGNWVLSTPQGELFLGVHGAHFYVANDGASLQLALAALPAKPGKMAHGAEFSVSPRWVAKGLAQVSLLDVIGAHELAGLFAAGTELGPLLSRSERISGWVESLSDGLHQAQLTWVLSPPPSPGRPVGPSDGG